MSLTLLTPTTPNVPDTSITTPLEHLLKISDCKTVSVTVFSDRAEVTRVVSFSPPPPLPQSDGGENDDKNDQNGGDDGSASLHTLVVQGMTTRADSDSIRVKLCEPHSSSSSASTKTGGGSRADVKIPANVSGKLIREVSYGIHARTRKSEDDSQRAKKARQAREDARARQTQIKSQLRRVKQRDELVHGYMKSMLVTPTLTSSSFSSSASALPPTAVGGPAAGAKLEVVEKLLEFHNTHSQGVDETVARLEKELKDAKTDEQTASTELRVCEANVTGTYTSRDVTILLDARTATTIAQTSGMGTVELSLTYIVSGASWAPIYDVRVDNLHQEPTPTSLDVTYSGVISQSTGEDWEGVAVRLSTAASPAGRGVPPLPPTRKAQFTRRQVQFRRNLATTSNALMPMQAAMPMQSAMPLHRAAMSRRMGRQRALSVDADEIGSDSDSADSCSADEANLLLAPSDAGTSKKKYDGVSATTFTIERTMTIKSDSKEHKCTIGVVTCPASFRLFATPELEELAYIQVRAKNDGGLTFLASDRVSVFLAGSFITKTPIKLTSPDESFTIFLGVESAVKVEHRTIKDVATKGGKKKSLLGGSIKSTRVVEMRTLLNNGLNRPVDITVVHLLPRSSNKKIVVTLTEPPRKNVQITGEKGGGNKGKVVNTGNSAGEGTLGSNSVAQNKLTNNVVFTRTLQPHSKQEIAFAYNMEWPHDEETGLVEIV